MLSKIKLRIEQIHKIIFKNCFFLLSGHFNIRSFPHAIFKATCLHFGFKNLPKSRLGGVLGRLGRVLEASWSVLGASWSVLGSCGSVLWASWCVLERLRASGARLQTSGARSDGNYNSVGAQHAPPLGPGEAQLSRRRKPYERNLTQKNYLQRVYESECMRVNAESECRE